MVGHVLLIPLKHVIDVVNERKVLNIVVKMKTHLPESQMENLNTPLKGSRN